MSIQKLLLLILCLHILPAIVLAQPMKTALARTVPEDVIVMVHKVATPEDDFAEEAWGRFTTALVESGIVTEALGLLTADLPAEQAALVEEHLKRAEEMITAVDWKSLASEEFLFTMRFDPSQPLAVMSQGLGPPDMVYLLRGAKAEANVEAITGILEYLASFSPKLELTRQAVDVVGESSAVLSLAGLFRIHVLRRGDLIIVAFGEKLLADCVAGLANGAAAPLVDSADFKHAFSTLPEPTISAAYSNLTPMWQTIGGGMKKLLEFAAAGAATDEKKASIDATGRLLDTIFRELSIMGRSAEVVHVDGARVIRDGAMYFGDGAEETIIHRAFFSGAPNNAWKRYVPHDAKGFRASSGFDLLLCYDEVLKLVESLVPGDKGKDFVQEWQTYQTEFGLDVREDLLGWIAGDTISFSLPKTGLSENSVVMLRVTDEAKAREMLKRLLDTCDSLLQNTSNPAMIRRSTPQFGEGFESVTHPQVMFFGLNMVLGVKDGWLFFGYSDEAVQRALGVAAGTEKGIVENPEFLKRAIDTGDALSMVSFTDLSGIVGEISQAVALAATFGGMAASQPETPQAVKRMFGMLSRVVGPLQQIDFLDSQYSQTMHHTDHIRTTTVTAYKEDVVASR